MTNAPEEVDQLAKTLKMAIPSARDMQSTAKPVVAKPVAKKAQPAKPVARPMPNNPVSRPATSVRTKPVAPSGGINFQRVFLLLALLFTVIFALYYR